MAAIPAGICVRRLYLLQSKTPKKNYNKWAAILADREQETDD